MTDITSIHDKFLKSILSDHEIAIAYFKTCLPKNIAGLLDLSSLIQLDDTYVSKELRKTISDIVYSCRVKDSSEDLKISLLLEHKSKPEKFTPIQLLSYMVSGYLKQVKGDRRVSPIIPVLLYHGRERWPYRTLVKFFENLNQELRCFIPEYDYVYHDLGEIPDVQIEAIENKFLQASMLALKYSRLKADLFNWIPTILSLASGAAENLQIPLYIYTFEVSELEEDQITELMEEVSANIKTNVMTTADVFVEKGKKIGLEEGDRIRTEKIVHNLIKSTGLSDEQIAAAAEVTVSYVARIREALHQV